MSANSIRSKLIEKFKTALTRIRIWALGRKKSGIRWKSLLIEWKFTFVCDGSWGFLLLANSKSSYRSFLYDRVLNKHPYGGKWRQPQPPCPVPPSHKPFPILPHSVRQWKFAMKIWRMHEIIMRTKGKMDASNVLGSNQDPPSPPPIHRSYAQTNNLCELKIYKLSINAFGYCLNADSILTGMYVVHTFVQSHLEKSIIQNMHWVQQKKK